MKKHVLYCAGAAIAVCSFTALSAEYKVPLTADGKPDLQGVWTNATATPFERARFLGDRRTYTTEEVAKIERTARARVENDELPTDPNAKIEAGKLPPVGNYNQFWTDRGMSVAVIDGEARTSMIIDPPNGRMPPLSAEGQRRLEKKFPGLAARFARSSGKLGEAFTGPAGFPGSGESEGESQGPSGAAASITAGLADGPEQRGVGERCLLGFGSTSGPPMLPTMYNSYYQIVQSPSTVLILVEMVHDARIIRIGGHHPPKFIRKWMGDSIGHWEGNTLVVETTNFRPEQSFRGTSEDAVITERFTRVAKNQIVYRFTVDDPTAFTAKFTAELPFTAVQGNIYEYACHEGNYALPGVLAGARADEKKLLQEKTSANSH